jgi:DNA-binding IclR family transcriptional regulator
VAPIGARLPLSVGASSKVLVAYGGEELVKQVLADPEWPASVDKEVYMQQLERIREDGYAISVEEREAGTAAVAVPVFSRRGRLIAALAVSGPVSRMNVKKMIQFVPRLIQAAQQMGRMVRD